MCCVWEEFIFGDNYCSPAWRLAEGKIDIYTMDKLLKATIYKKVPNSQSEVELLESGVSLPAVHLEEYSSDSTLCG